MAKECVNLNSSSPVEDAKRKKISTAIRITGKRHTRPVSFIKNSTLKRNAPWLLEFAIKTGIGRKVSGISYALRGRETWIAEKLCLL